LEVYQLHASSALSPLEEPQVVNVIGRSMGPRKGMDDAGKKTYLAETGVELRILGYTVSIPFLYRFHCSKSVYTHVT
jgi:hypothetical protein